MKRYLLTISLILMVSGCASILKGKKQNISVNANVNSADVYLVDLKKNKEERIGVTPFMGKVQRLKEAKLVVKKDGYKPVEILLDSQIEPAFWVNILCGGTIGSSTDMSTGAMWKYSQNSYMANLAPGSKGAKLEQFKIETPVRMFCVMNYDRLNSNISTGKGEYLNSLYSLLEVKTQGDKESMLVKIREAQVHSKSVPDFAERIVTLL